MNAGTQAQTSRDSGKRGLSLGIGAYALWGILPIYFKAIAEVGPVGIVAHRVLLYGERFTRWHAIAFGSIWLALGLYVTAVIRGAKSAAPAMPPE